MQCGDGDGLVRAKPDERELVRSGAVAIGEAFKLIQRGGARMMLAGGVEAPLAPLTFGSFDLDTGDLRRLE